MGGRAVTSPEHAPKPVAGNVRLRATLLSVWSVTPDADFRQSIERELYGQSAPDRAAEEWERLRVLVEGD